MNKDVARIIGKYALPKVWRVKIACLNHEYFCCYILSEDKERIYQWLTENKKDWIYNVIYDLNKMGLKYSLAGKVILKMEYDLSLAKAEYYQNTYEFVKGLNEINFGVKIERVDLINLY